MICPNCHREVPDTAKACGYCGHWLAPVNGKESTIEMPGDKPTVEAPGDEPTVLADKPKSSPPWLWIGPGVAVLVVVVAVAAGAITLFAGVDTKATVATAIAATEQAKAGAVQPAEEPTKSPPPTRTPRPTPPPLASLSSVPEPDIPIYDDFEDGVISKSWYDPKWSATEGRQVTYEVDESEGVLHFDVVNDTNIDRWGHFVTARGQKLQEIYMSITIEEITGNGGLGLVVHSSNAWYVVDVWPDGISLSSNKQPWKTVQNTTCCPTTHLLGARVDGTEIHFYIDDNLVASLPESENLENSGVFIFGDQKSKMNGYVDNVWIRFVEAK